MKPSPTEAVIRATVSKLDDAIAGKDLGVIMSSLAILVANIAIQVVPVGTPPNGFLDQFSKHAKDMIGELRKQRLLDAARAAEQIMADSLPTQKKSRLILPQTPTLIRH